MQPVFADVPSDSFTLTVRPRDSFPPKPVTDLTALPGGEGQMALSWTAPHEDDIGTPSGDPVASYDVRYATYSADSLGSTTTWFNQATPVSGEPTPASPGSGELFQIPGSLEPGTTLWFAIESVDDSANTSPIDDKTNTPTQQAFAVVFDSAPPSPANLNASATDTQVNLTWNAVTVADLDFYRIYVDSTSPYDFADAFTLTVDSVSVSTSHTGLTNDATYYYRVTAVDKGAVNSPDYVGAALESLPSNTVSAIPNAASIPNAPTLTVDLANTTTAQVRWVLTDNATNESGLAVYNPLLPGDVSPNLGPLSGTGGTTGYTETGFTPDTAVMRFGRAYNVNGSSFSALVTVHTLANPPAATTVGAVSTGTLTFVWDANGNPGTVAYPYEISDNASFNGATSGTASATTVTIEGLQPNSNYWFRVRARNSDGVLTAYDTTVAAKTDKLKDTVPPKAPTGIWGEWMGQSPAQLKLHWRPVEENVDGTKFDDPAAERYRIYRTETYNLDPTVKAPKVMSVEPPVTAQGNGEFGPNAVDTLDAGQLYYYRLRTVDLAGNESADSMLLQADGDGTFINVIATADDLHSRIALPVDVARALLLKETNGLGDDILLRATEQPDQEKGRVVKAVKYEALRATTGEVIKDFFIKPARGVVMIGYSVQNGQVIQGAPAVNSKGGAPVFDASKASEQLSLFWHNGVEWVKVGGQVDTSDQIVTLKTSRLGAYQIRQAIRVGPASITKVYPQIFSPNEDGWNDKVVFEFDNPALLPLKGEVFDVSGAKVADLTAGPNPDSSLVWDGKKGGAAVPDGVYIYQIEVGGESVTGTVVVAK